MQLADFQSSVFNIQFWTPEGGAPAPPGIVVNHRGREWASSGWKELIDGRVHFEEAGFVDAATISYPHLERHPDGIRLERLPRIRVSMIVADYLGHGWSADQIAEQYPHLRPGEIHSAMAYYFDHPEEIHQILAAEVKQVEMAAGTALKLKLQRAKENSER